MNLLKLYHNINEGFDFQGIADDFNNKQDELENNNGLDIDLNKNIDITFSSFKDLKEVTIDYLNRNKGIFYKRFTYLKYDLYCQRKVFGLYMYSQSSVRIDISAFKEINGNFIEHNFSCIFINPDHIYIVGITSNLVQKIVSLLNTISECIIKKAVGTFENKYTYNININLNLNKIKKLPVNNWINFLDIIKQYIIKTKINNKGLLNINEGFDFQGIADDFNEHQDELENNNGLNTDLDKNLKDINFMLNSVEDEFYAIFNFLKDKFRWIKDGRPLKFGEFKIVESHFSDGENKKYFLVRFHDRNELMISIDMGFYKKDYINLSLFSKDKEIKTKLADFLVKNKNIISYNINNYTLDIMLQKKMMLYDLYKILNAYLNILM